MRMPERAMEDATMSKSHDAHKNTLKKPLLTPKQKREAKRAKQGK